MSRSETKIHEALQLLQARQDALEMQRQRPLLSLGKWLRADVFAWHNPPAHALIDTLCNWPYPVIWIGTTAQAKQVNWQLRKREFDFRALILFGEQDEDFAEELVETHYVQSGQEALQIAQNLLGEKSIVLLTTDEELEQEIHKRIKRS